MKLDDLQKALSDNVIFKNTFKELTDVIAAANEFPKYKDPLYEAMFAHPSHFVKSFADVYEIAKFFMQDGQRKRLLTWLLKFGDDEYVSMFSPILSFFQLKSLINYFDTGADRELFVIKLFSCPQINDVINGYFKKYPKFSSVENVIRDIEMIYCPSSNVVKKAVMKSLLLCPDDLFISLIKDVYEFKDAIQWLSPVNGEDLAIKVLDNKLLPDKYFGTIGNYLRVLDLLPEKLKQEILEKSCIENNFLGKKIETFDDLMSAIRVLPVYFKEKLINKVFEDAAIMKGLSLTVRNCIVLANFFTGEIKDKLIDIIPMDYQQILAITYSSALQDLNIDLSFVENLLERYISSSLSDSSLTSNIAALVTIAKLFPNIKSTLEKEIAVWPLIHSAVAVELPPAQVNKIYINDSLSNFRESYPAVNLISRLQPSEVKLLVSSLVDFDKFFKGADESEKELFVDFIMRLDEGEFISTIKNTSRLMVILEAFPSHTVKLIEKVLNNEIIQKALIKSDLDISVFILKFPKASSLIESWMSSSEYAKKISEFNALILSVQKPHNTHLPGPQSGKSGLFLQQVTNAGYIYLHRNKTFSANDHDIASKHLKPNGWLIVTGHGGAEGEELSGLYHVDCYRVDENISVDITLTPNELCQMILSTNCLKAEDHINIVLYCCYAGYGSSSYASQLMKALNDCGISSNIIACEGVVGRISGYSISDVPEKFIKFRANSRFKLFVGDEYQMPLKDMYFSSKKIHIANNDHFNEEAVSYFLTMMKAEALKLNLHENLEIIDSMLLNHLTVENYNLSYLDAQRVSKEKNCVVIHKSDDSKNIIVTLPSGQFVELKHEYDGGENFLSNKITDFLRFAFASTYPIVYHIKQELDELIVKPGCVDIEHYEMDQHQAVNFIIDNMNAIIIRKSSMKGNCAISYCKANEPFQVMHDRFAMPKIFIEGSKVRLNHPTNISYCALLKTTLPKINESISSNNKQVTVKEGSSSSSQVGLFSLSSAAASQGGSQAVEAKNDDLPSTKPQ